MLSMFPLSLDHIRDYNLLTHSLDEPIIDKRGGKFLNLLIANNDNIVLSPVYKLEHSLSSFLVFPQTACLYTNSQIVMSLRRSKTSVS